MLDCCFCFFNMALQSWYVVKWFIFLSLSVSILRVSTKPQVDVFASKNIIHFFALMLPIPFVTRLILSSEYQPLALIQYRHPHSNSHYLLQLYYPRNHRCCASSCSLTQFVLLCKSTAVSVYIRCILATWIRLNTSNFFLYTSS